MRTAAVRGVPADLFDDFESYTAGQSLVDQSDWFNNTDTGDTVIASGIVKNSGAHISDGSQVFGQVLGKASSSSEFGTLSLDVRLDTTASSVYVFPYSDSADRLLNTGVSFISGGSVLVFQDSNPSDGFLDLVTTNANWQAGVPFRLDFDVSGTGMVEVRLDGRTILIGEDTAKVNNNGIAAPVKYIGVRTSNSTAGEAISIDNVSDVITSNADAAGESDLYHAVGVGNLTVGDTLQDIASIYREQVFTITTLTVNTSNVESALDVAVELDIPPELDLLANSCSGAMQSGTFVSDPFDLGPGNNRACTFDLRLNASLPNGPGDLRVLATRTQTASTDPYPDNDAALFFLFEDAGVLFEDSFETLP